MFTLAWKLNELIFYFKKLDQASWFKQAWTKKLKRCPMLIQVAQQNCVHVVDELNLNEPLLNRASNNSWTTQFIYTLKPTCKWWNNPSKLRIFLFFLTQNSNRVISLTSSTGNLNTIFPVFFGTRLFWREGNIIILIKTGYLQFIFMDSTIQFFLLSAHSGDLNRSIFRACRKHCPRQKLHQSDTDWYDFECISI